MTKPSAVLFLLLLISTATARAQDSPPEKRTGFLDAIYGALFGSQATARASDPVDDQTKQHESTKRIEVMADFDEAIKLSQLEQRPVLLIAGAEWCTWCRKLEKELGEDDAEPILTKWIVVKIDVDALPSLAEEFEVSSLPSLRVLSAERAVAAKRDGYLPLAELQAWLDEAAPQVDPSLTRVLYDTGLPDEDQLVKLVEFLGNRSPSLRQSAVRRLSDAQEVSAKPVIDVLKAGRLSQKLCAIDILRSWGAPVEGLDPWQPESISSEVVEELSCWMAASSVEASH